MNDDFSSIGGFPSPLSDYYPPQATVSLAETTLLTPSTPESFVGVKEEDETDKKPSKKRKSWGQELPTPKTNLPPRKRAKTEDEKEQRRIERVLRNRQAAQSSRERKRQEVEKLEGEKMTIEHENQVLKDRLRAAEHEKLRLTQKLAKMAAEMSTYKSKSTSVAASIVSTPDSSPTLTADLLHRQAIKQELDDYPFALPSPQNTLGPRHSSVHSTSPSSRSSSRSMSPPRITLDGTPVPDMTQHPAVMLCGLQCQSGTARCQSSRFMPSEAPQRLPQMHLAIVTTMHLLCLTVYSAAYSTILAPLSQIFISLKTGSPLTLNKTCWANQVDQQTAVFHLIQWLISTPVNPMTHSSHSTTHSRAVSTATTNMMSSRPTFRISLLRRLLACSPALARPLKGATARALQMKASGALNGKESHEDVLGGGARGSSLGMDVRSDDDWSTWMTMAAAIELTEKEKSRVVARGGDAANDIRQLCITLDGLFDGRVTKRTKVGDSRDSSWRSKGQVGSRAALSGKPL
ncbi:MAG: BZIP transcription factor [Lasallia pustulata]|uniref:BZIP transcription factor n=1 Tax=Lasallia pustulata TaxID=136370 RepID=A0A5M8PSY4_9LECA|nr:MAG: BZIP transcription factor [Lasallia pustulata]